MAAPNGDAVVVRGRSLAAALADREALLWGVAVAASLVDVALAAAGARPVAGAPAALAGALAVEAAWGLAAAKGLGLGLAAAAWAVLPEDLRAAAPAVVAALSAALVVAARL